MTYLEPRAGLEKPLMFRQSFVVGRSVDSVSGSIFQGQNPLSLIVLKEPHGEAVQPPAVSHIQDLKQKNFQNLMIKLSSGYQPDQTRLCISVQWFLLAEQ